MELSGLCGRIERRHFALVCLAVLVTLAGCAGGTGGDGTETATPTATATPDATPEGTPDSGQSPLPSEANIDNFSAGEGLSSDLRPAEDLSMDRDQVVGDALTAIERVDSYRLVGDSTIRTQTNNVDQTQELQRVTRVDRDRPALSVNTTISARGQTRSQQDYYVDGTLYQNSQFFAPQYGSEWIQRNISENFTQILKESDRLSLYRSIMDNGTATLEGTQSIDGTEAYRIQVRTEGSAAAGVLGLGEANGTDAELVTTFWVDTENSTVLRVDGAVEIVTTQQGQTAVVSGTFVESLTYGGVAVTLPDAASSSVEVGTPQRTS